MSLQREKITIRHVPTLIWAIFYQYLNILSNFWIFFPEKFTNECSSIKTILRQKYGTKVEMPIFYHKNILLIELKFLQTQYFKLIAILYEIDFEHFFLCNKNLSLWERFKYWLRRIAGRGKKQVHQFIDIVKDSNFNHYKVS